MKHRAISQAVFAIAAGSSAVTVPALAADDPVVLEPSSPWAVDYAEDGCNLVRTFGEGDDQVVFRLSQNFRPQSFWLTLGGEAIRKFRYEREVTFRFGPDEASQTQTASPGILGDVPIMMFRTGFAPASKDAARKAFAAFIANRMADPHNPLSREKADAMLAAIERGNNLDQFARSGAYGDDLSDTRIAAITEVHLEKGFRRDIVLATGSMGPPMKVMAACRADFIKYWMPPDEVSRPSGEATGTPTPPVPRNNPGEWITANDYPREELNKNAGGIVYFDLLIDKTGKPIACFTPFAIGNLSAVACEKIKERARFAPARAPDGTALRSSYSSKVRFMVDNTTEHVFWWNP